MLLTDIYVLHIAFTKLLLGRLMVCDGCRSGCFPQPSPGLVHFPQWPGTSSALLLCSLALGLAVSARQFSTRVCCYPKQTVLGGLFINFLATTGEMQCRETLQGQGVSHGQEGWEGRIAAQLLYKKIRNSSLIAIKILNNLFIGGWMTTKRHHPSDFQWYLSEREAFAWRRSCMPDLWLQTGLLCAFSSLFLHHKAAKSVFESPLWKESSHFINNTGHMDKWVS